jgi:hypothetical protein
VCRNPHILGRTRCAQQQSLGPDASSYLPGDPIHALLLIHYLAVKMCSPAHKTSRVKNFLLPLLFTIFGWINKISEHNWPRLSHFCGRFCIQKSEPGRLSSDEKVKSVRRSAKMREELLIKEEPDHSQIYLAIIARRAFRPFSSFALAPPLRRLTYYPTFSSPPNFARRQMKRA